MPQALLSAFSLLAAILLVLAGAYMFRSEERRVGKEC